MPRASSRPVMPNMALGNLWRFLGPVKGKPFRPFAAQFHALSTIRIPWPGMYRRRGEQNYRPYPTIFGVNCGRRFGKTTLAEIKAWEAFLAPDDMFGPPTVRITADTFEHGQKIWDRFVWHAENTELSALIKSHSRTRNLITGTNGATIQLLSAENPQSLAGDGVTCWLIDEAQYLTYPAWENLFPSTAERDGVIVMFGVAEGEGPFREICFKGDDPETNPEYLRLCYPTAANPYVPRWRIEFAMRQYTPSRFKQLYLAEWDTDTGKVFRNVEGCIVPGIPTLAPQGWGEVVPPRPGHVYYGGLDLALYSDWCVYTICDRDGNLVAWDRFNRTSWELLKARVFALSSRYGHPLTWVDSNGSGDPIFDDLQRRGMNVEGYKANTNERKRAMVDELAIRIGAGTVKYPRIPQLVQELQVFEAKKSKNSGAILYEAPAGMHDDFVIALSLMVKGCPRPMSPALAALINSGEKPVRQYSEADFDIDPDIEDDEEYRALLRDLATLDDYGQLRGHEDGGQRQMMAADYL